MEKYSQFRDRGSGIAPFFPVPTTPSGLALPIHVSIFLLRLCFLVPTCLTYFALLSWLPVGPYVKKAALWCILGVFGCGCWWVDLQIDGVKKGSLARSNAHRIPHPSTIIASSLTSPIDPLYLATVFDPIFTLSYPSTRLVRRLTLLQAILHALLPPTPSTPPPTAKLHSLSDLLLRYPDRCIAVFPECTTTNGRGILPFSPSLLTAPARARIFPVSVRYTPADITTPVPYTFVTFLWNLLSKPTHCIRVRIAEAVFNTSLDEGGAMATASAARPVSGGKTKMSATASRNSYETNFLDTLQEFERGSSSETLVADSAEGGLGGDGVVSEEGRKVLDKVAEDLARLGRVKRVGLTVQDKVDFIKVWTRRR